MKEIKLFRLVLRNFKGINNLEIEPNGKDLAIYGDNGTGKTTIADAFSWLLFGKDSIGRADFEIKTLNKEGEAIHFLDHSVYADLEIDGDSVTLEKIYREKWVKQRGSIDREFQGHETEYIIDGIPKSKAEFTAFVKSIADEDVFRLLTNPMYFNNNLDKKKRREMLFDIFGDLSDHDVIARNFALLGDLEALVGKYTIGELEVATTQKKRRVNGDLQAIPNRIDEANRFIVTMSSFADGAQSEEELAEVATQLDTEIRAKTEELNDLDANAGKDNFRAQANEEIRRLTVEHRNKIAALSNDVEVAKSAFRSCENEVRGLELDIEHKKRSCEWTIKAINNANEELERLRAEWTKVFNSTYNGDRKCPTCGQDLPADELATRESKFLEAKSAKLESITAEGEAVATSKTTHEENLATSQAEIVELTNRLEALKECLARKKNEVDKARGKVENAEAISRAEIELKKRELEAQEFALERDEKHIEVRNSLITELNELRAKKKAVESDIFTLQQNEKAKKRVEELEVEARSLSAEYERLERQDFLIGEFKKLKASMLEERINSRFKYAKFKLFDKQINGGIVETCEVTYNGVPYGALNNAAKINMGLDIINVFSEHYGLSTVIFLDNAESVTKIFKTNNQQIRLYVAEDDKTLRIEIERA